MLYGFSNHPVKYEVSQLHPLDTTWTMDYGYIRIDSIKDEDGNKVIRPEYGGTTYITVLCNHNHITKNIYELDDIILTEKQKQSIIQQMKSSSGIIIY